MTDSSSSDLHRVRDEIVGRLTARGIRVSNQESPEELVRLLDSVEHFEAVVRRRGGDLMVDEPVADRPVRRPDDPAFVLPARETGEPMEHYTERVDRAAARAEREPPLA